MQIKRDEKIQKRKKKACSSLLLLFVVVPFFSSHVYIYIYWLIPSNICSKISQVSLLSRRSVFQR